MVGVENLQPLQPNVMCSPYFPITTICPRVAAIIHSQLIIHNS
jgi:hypothetical protein